MVSRKEVVDDDPLDREIDFSKGRPNPFWLGCVDRKCVRLLDRDLADVFPDNTTVNEALRSLVRANSTPTVSMYARKSDEEAKSGR